MLPLQARRRRAQRQPNNPWPDPDPATVPLPAELVNGMLLDRYLERYQRLGLVDAARAAGAHPAWQQL